MCLSAAFLEVLPWSSGHVVRLSVSLAARISRKPDTGKSTGNDPEPQIYTVASKEPG